MAAINPYEPIKAEIVKPASKAGDIALIAFVVTASFISICVLGVAAFLFGYFVLGIH